MASKELIREVIGRLKADTVTFRINDKHLLFPFLSDGDTRFCGRLVRQQMRVQSPPETMHRCSDGWMINLQKFTAGALLSWTDMCGTVIKVNTSVFKVIAARYADDIHMLAGSKPRIPGDIREGFGYFAEFYRNGGLLTTQDLTRLGNIIAELTLCGVDKTREDLEAYRILNQLLPKKMLISKGGL